MSAKSKSGGSQRQFTKEFKAEAVAIVAVSGGYVAKAARELNIYDSTLGNWVRRAREETDACDGQGARPQTRRPQGRRSHRPQRTHPNPPSSRSDSRLIGAEPNPNRQPPLGMKRGSRY